MDITKIYNSSYNLSAVINSLVLTSINTITNTITIQKLKGSIGSNAGTGTTITIQKDRIFTFNVNKQ